MENKEKLKKKIDEKLDVPPKALEGDKNKEIEKSLGAFLVKEGYIKDIKEREEDWGFVYYSATRDIAVSQKEMPHGKWEKCIFKMGVNDKTGENLFPEPGKETEKYRFLHEASHAYQEYLCHKESPDNPLLWHEKSLEGEIESSYSHLFRFCFAKRMEAKEERKEKEDSEKGLSIWGNVTKYKGDGVNKESEVAVRAQEDANELITMFLWHPDYLTSYLDYLTLNHENSRVREREVTREDLEKRGLVQLSRQEASYLEEVIESYVEEMKCDIMNEAL